MTANTTHTRTQPTATQTVVAGTRPRPSASAGEVVLAYLRLQAHQLASLEPTVRTDEPDAVHQMRVASRRLRATFRSFGSVIPRPGTEHVAAELKWLGGLLGAARDGEVLPEHLQASLRPMAVEVLIGPVLARVQGYYAPRRAAARLELLEALDSPRYVQLLAELDRLAAGPLLGPRADAPARDVLPAAVRRAYRQARRRMRRARHAPPGDRQDVALHEVRKAARRARYAAEAASPALGTPARRFARQMKRVQSVLGGHQDTVLARHATRELGIAAHLAGENAFTYGLLYEGQSHRAERLRKRARQVWKQASRPRYRRRMS
ncbi:MAG TPA: CHAD domain-containing protein [Streptosporangiaceae bacterium]|nr:CHAD domain-containing protein [Streptosporangiaceae bacterium]